jgi:glyoxylase-like metal-dependent hydrolase (beta-lactamase superfamily II)/rhodanese-related sulfurtransferase
MELEVFVTPGLGDNSYLIASGGEAALVDPQRDVARFLAAAEARGVSVRHVLETHVHNDYLSGALELRAATGAEIETPAGGRYEFPTRPLVEGDEVKVGDLLIVAMETPGHTPEHLSYLVYEGGSDEPIAVFTGGSMMVGGAGRTDLLGPDRTDELTRAQYRSLRRLAELPPGVQILPTHGAGSFCGSGPAPADRTSTLRLELSRNLALAVPDESTFVRQQLSGLLAYPTYYGSMAPLNRTGPRLLADVPEPQPLDPPDFAARHAAGAWIVDGRWRVPFARAHLPGSLNPELEDTFGSYVGWVVPFGDPIVLVLPEPEEETLAVALTQLLRIGYERVEGYLRGGIDAWRASGRPVDSYRVAGLEELCRAYRAGRATRVLDVRQETEWDRGHIPGSQHVFVGDLPERIGEVPRDGEVWAICATGHRAALAASILDREGVPVRLVEGTGVTDFLEHCSAE